MNLNTLPYILPLSLTVLGSLMTAYYIWRRGGFEAIVSIVILLAGAEWVSAYILEIIPSSLPVKVFWNQMQYVGGSIMVTGLFILALQSTGYDKWLTWQNILLINIVPIFCLLLIFTNQYHGLIWPYHVLVARRGVLWLEHPHGPFYWVYTGYVQLLMLVILLFLIWSIFRSPKQFRRQALMIASGILFTFIVSTLGPFGLNFLHPLNLNQMSFVVGVIPISVGLLRLQVGDIVPVARAAVFDGMDDCVFVVDAQSRIIDINVAAQKFFKVAGKEVIGQLMETVSVDGRALETIGQPVARSWLKPSGRIYRPDENAVISQEVILGENGEKRIFDMRVSPIVDWRSYIMSQVIVLRDITERVQAEQIVKKAKDDLETKVAGRTAELSQANQQLLYELTERQEAETALKQARDELEQRVSERTAELAQINEQLTHELAERRHIEQKIKISLQEKEVLLKEIHHRVKNNLQVISSMLNLQSDYMNDEAVLSIFQDSQHRVRSMALIHEKLYQSENLALVDFGDYIENLAAYLVRSYGGHTQGVCLKIEAETVHLGIDTAVPCGLILNELISNALKYAFPDGKPGQIVISLQLDSNNQVCLSVSDDGVGLPPGLDILNTPSLGLQLVHALVGQLGGRLQIEQADGVKFSITCPFVKGVHG